MRVYADYHSSGGRYGGKSLRMAEMVQELQRAGYTVINPVEYLDFSAWKVIPIKPPSPVDFNPFLRG